MFGSFAFAGSWFAGVPTYFESGTTPTPEPEVDVLVCLYYDCCTPDQFGYDLNDI
jgi:hypothetical protein